MNAGLEEGPVGDGRLMVNLELIEPGGSSGEKRKMSREQTLHVVAKAFARVRQAKLGNMGKGLVFKPPKGGGGRLSKESVKAFDGNVFRELSGGKGSVAQVAEMVKEDEKLDEGLDQAVEAAGEGGEHTPCAR